MLTLNDDVQIVTGWYSQINSYFLRLQNRPDQVSKRKTEPNIYFWFSEQG